MRISRLEIRGFRSLLSVDLALDDLTVLTGPNGSGKSSVLHALTLFLDPAATIEERDLSQSLKKFEVTVTVTVQDSSRAGAPSRTIRKSFTSPNAVGEYSESTRAIPDFADIRSAAKGHRAAYDQLRKNDPWTELPAVSNKAGALAALNKWESDHPESCVLMSVPLDSRSALGGLEAIDHVFVGALDDPGSEIDPERRGAVSRALQYLVVNEAVQEGLRETRQTAVEGLARLVEQQKTDLANAETAIRNAVGLFAPSLDVRLSLLPDQSVVVQPPRPQLELVEPGGVATDSTRQGHGVQRSLLFAVLASNLEHGRTRGDATVLLAIEEPETFQHPLRSRFIARVLTALSRDGYQVIVTTHSSNMIVHDRIAGLRRLTQVNGVSTVHSMDLESLVGRWKSSEATDADITVASLRARLRALLTSSVLEGVFAERVVLVEGAEDIALIAAQAYVESVDLDQSGIALVSCGGKANIPLACAFFLELGIDVYAVFDLDRDRAEEEQHRWAEAAVLNLLGVAPQTLAGTELHERFCCWENNIGQSVRTEVGRSVFDESMAEARSKLGFSANQGKKNAAVIEDALTQWQARGAQSSTLRALVTQLAAR